MLCGGHGVLYERQPFVGAPYVYAGGLGGRPAAYAPVRLDVIVVEYRHAEDRDSLFTPRAYLKQPASPR